MKVERGEQGKKREWEADRERLNSSPITTDQSKSNDTYVENAQMSAEKKV